MNRQARREIERARARRQIERRDLIAKSEAMAVVGREPTLREYVTYHCYMTVAGKSPQSYMGWVASLGVQNGMDGGLP